MTTHGHADHVRRLTELIGELDAVRARVGHLIEEPSGAASPLAIYNLASELGQLCRAAALSLNVAESRLRLAQCSACLARVHKLLGLH
jgi:glyoxylase-like metal-dependent hydrolase (beta-lactamase superfamily II)